MGEKLRCEDRIPWAACLGFGLLLGALLEMVIDSSPFAAFFDVDAYRLLLMGALLGSAAWCTVAVVRCGRSGPSRRIGVGAGLVACVAVCSSGALVAGGAVAGALVAAVFGLVLGAAVTVLVLSWGALYARLPFGALTRTTACSFAVALVSSAVMPLAREGAAPVYTMLLLAASVGLLAWVGRAGKGGLGGETALDAGDGAAVVGRVGSEAPSSSRGMAVEGETPHPLRGTLRLVWQPMLLAMVVAWGFGQVWNPSVMAGDSDGMLVYGLSLTVGLAMGLGLYLGLVAVSGRRMFSSALCSSVLAVAAAVLLLLPSFAGDIFVPASFVLHALSWACLAAIFLMVWTQLVDAGRGAASGAIVPVALGLGACSLSMLAGVALVPVLGRSGRVVSTVLYATYFVLTVMFLSRALQAAPIEADSGVAVPSASKDFKERCAAVCRDYRLTRRESEVFGYLARGHSQAYIADELGISENTVHTHARNIYEKLGVSSKEGLLKLVSQVLDEEG